MKLDHIATASFHAAHFDLVHTAVKQRNHLAHCSFAHQCFKVAHRQVELGVCLLVELAVSHVDQVYQRESGCGCHQLDRRIDCKRGRVRRTDRHGNGVGVGSSGESVPVVTEEARPDSVAVVAKDANATRLLPMNVDDVAVLHLKRVGCVIIHNRLAIQ